MIILQIIRLIQQHQQILFQNLIQEINSFKNGSSFYFQKPGKSI